MEIASYQWRFLSEIPGISKISISKPFNPDSSYSNSYPTLFAKHKHINYLATSSPLGPLSISLIRLGGTFKGIIRSREGI